MRFLSILFLFCLFVSKSYAVENYLEYPEQEFRAKELFKEIRCVVCDGESISDSNADLAKDLRILIRNRIRAGDGDQAIIEDLVARYGQQILMQPPVNSSTLFLWSAPIILLAIAILFIIITFRKK